MQRSRNQNRGRSQGSRAFNNAFIRACIRRRLRAWAVRYVTPFGMGVATVGAAIMIAVALPLRRLLQKHERAGGETLRIQRNSKHCRQRYHLCQSP